MPRAPFPGKAAPAAITSTVPRPPRHARRGGRGLLSIEVTACASRPARPPPWALASAPTSTRGSVCAGTTSARSPTLPDHWTLHEQPAEPNASYQAALCPGTQLLRDNLSPAPSEAHGQPHGSTAAMRLSRRPPAAASTRRARRSRRCAGALPVRTEGCRTRRSARGVRPAGRRVRRRRVRRRGRRRA